MTTAKTDNWEEERVYGRFSSNILELISQTETRVKEELIQKVEGMKPDDVYNGAVVIRVLNDVISLIKKP